MGDNLYTHIHSCIKHFTQSFMAGKTYFLTISGSEDVFIVFLEQIMQ